MRSGERRGVAALEFALVAPVLVAVLTCLADLGNAVLMKWQIAAAADAIGRIATSLAVTDTATNQLSLAQAAVAATAAYPLLPALRHGGSLTGFEVVLSTVVFTLTDPACTTDCTYAANVAWSAVVQGSGAARPCGTLLASVDAAPPTLASLPADAFTSTPLLIVDVRATYVPLVTTPFGAEVPMTGSAILAARTGAPSDWTRLTGPNAKAAQCPGYQD